VQVSSTGAAGAGAGAGKDDLIRFTDTNLSFVLDKVFLQSATQVCVYACMCVCVFVRYI